MFAIALRRCCTGARRQDETSMSLQSHPGPVAPPARRGGRWPYHPPWPLDSGGEGKRRVDAQSNGGGSCKPRGGKREASERQAERSVALWTKQSGSQVPLRRAPHSAPTSPASLCPPAGTSQQNKHTSTPHPEPLSEHMIRAMRRRGIKRDTPSVSATTSAHSPRILCSVSASASGWGAQQHLKQRAGTDGEGRRSRGQSTERCSQSAPVRPSVHHRCQALAKP